MVQSKAADFEMQDTEIVQARVLIKQECICIFELAVAYVSQIPVLDCSNARIVASNPVWIMDVCPRFSVLWCPV
jgi:hypothetical protein